MDNNKDEVNLIRYLRVLIKNKFIILAFFLIGIIFALCVIFFMPKTYQTNAIIEIGKMENTLGEMTFLRNANEVTNEINYSFTQKYPSLRATPVSDGSDGLIRIYNYSNKKEEAEESVSGVASIILSEDNSNKDRIQTQINKLKIDMNGLKLEGQQTADIDLKLLDLQNKLDSLVPTKIIQQSTAYKGIFNPFLDLLLGGILGLFVGLVVVSIKDWWEKNKKNII